MVEAENTFTTTIGNVTMFYHNKGSCEMPTWSYVLGTGSRKGTPFSAYNGSSEAALQLEISCIDRYRFLGFLNACTPFVPTVCCTCALAA